MFAFVVVLRANHFMSFAGLSTCENAIFWLNNWFDGRSVLQLFCYAVVALALIWVTLGFCRMHLIDRLAWVLQGVIVIGIGGAVASVHATILPYAAPTQADALDVYDAIFRTNSSWYLFEEERAVVFLDPASAEANWPYDFPPPPTPPEYPWELERVQFAELFPSSTSPEKSELSAAHQCAVDYRAALYQYDEDLAKYEAALAEWESDHGGKITSEE